MGCNLKAQILFWVMFRAFLPLFSAPIPNKFRQYNGFVKVGLQTMLLQKVKQEPYLFDDLVDLFNIIDLPLTQGVIRKESQEVMQVAVGEHGHQFGHQPPCKTAPQYGCQATALPYTFARGCACTVTRGRIL